MTTIYCFTSTGNSLYAAKKIATALNGQVLPMKKDAICSDEVIGFVFPNFFWGLPRIVERFVRDLQITNKDAYVFGVMACGGPSFGALGALRGSLEEKGIELSYANLLICSSNYLPEYLPKDTPAIRQKIESKLTKIIRDIQSKKLKHPISPTPVNKYIQSIFPDASSDQFFTVSSACTSCRTCEKVCPVGNITLVEGKPTFRQHCEHCIACLHLCPAEAIDWKGVKTQGKSRYRNSNVDLTELLAFGRDESNLDNQSLLKNESRSG